jgi:predicted phosphodiesterase
LKRAVLSDIHGNLEALDAVLRDIDRRNDRGAKIEEAVCLGDVFGYGPNPRECVDLVRRRCKVVLAGNHELGLLQKIKTPQLGLTRATGFGGLGAREGILWAIHQLYRDPTPVGRDDDYTRSLIERMKAPDYEARLARELSGRLPPGSGFRLPLKERLLKAEGAIVRQFLEGLLLHADVRPLVEEFFDKVRARREGDDGLRYLGTLPTSARLDGALLVHDNPFHPGDGKYVLDGASQARVKSTSAMHGVDKVFAEYDWKETRLVLFGHSHFPGIYTDKKRPGAVLANPGSVGIPRGERLEATYLLWDPDGKTPKRALQLVRLPLTSWEATGRKMEQAGLPNKLKLVADKTPKELD